MDDMTAVRMALIELRVDAKLSQAELAKRLDCAPSRVSRLESGDLQLSHDEAGRIALAIGETYPPGKLFADYLGWEWKILERPGFNHVSLPALRQAEQALQQLDPLLNDHAFVQQIRSCREGIINAATYLANTEHGIAFVGPPKVGKTTAICALSEDLHDPTQEDLGDQMVLKTGGGKVTICEVHVRRGDEYSITVDACNRDEIEQFVAEFCEDLIKKVHMESPTSERRGTSEDSLGLPAEIEKAIRNMARLPRPTSQKGKDGKPVIAEDPAIELARKLSKEDLLVEIMTRLDLPRRIGTSLNYPRGSATSRLQWLKHTYRELNFGLHPDFSLPRRIEVVVPKPILGVSNLSIRLIDTRGYDEPSAERRDLQNYFTDLRTLIVLCSSFGSPPDATSQAVIKRTAEDSMRSPLAHKALLLILPQGKEEQTVLNQVGEEVSDENEGREIRRYETLSRLGQLGAPDLPVGFLNAISLDDRRSARQQLVELVGEMRRRYEVQIEELASTVGKLLNKKKEKDIRNALVASIGPLQDWFDKNQNLEDVDHDIQSKLLRDMRAIGHAGHLRAAVNRRGSGDNFDYWLGLGLGTKQHTVAQTTEQLTGLKRLIRKTLDNSDLSEAHGFLKHFQSQVDNAVVEFYRQVTSVGETAFSKQLREDAKYWSTCKNRWGEGKGYKDDISCWTKDWFKEDAELRNERYIYINKQVKLRWRVMLAGLSAQLKSGVAVDGSRPLE